MLPFMDSSLPTRSRILEGAARAIARVGIRPVTVRDIVAAAGVSRRTFYQYFGDKEDVVLVLYEQHHATLVQDVSEAVRAASTDAERLRAPVDAYLEFQQRGGKLLGLLQAEAVNPESRLFAEREHVMDELVNLTRRAVAANRGPALDPLLYRTLFLGLEDAVLHLRRGGPLAPDDRARMARNFHAIFAAVLSSAAADPQRFPGPQ